MDKPHKRLVAWQKGMDLVVLIYKLTKSFPKEETYGLISQLRGASISVPSNIAEGAADRSNEQFRNFLSISIGSLNEINTQVELAFRIGYLDKENYDAVQNLVDECLRTTYGLKRSIEQKIS
ncbi:MAG TPA: four helix bundle protein [Pyrinomonadaceae bacterium]|nr:four helix bundle protein [Pyrinomonadaceae bacterium]